MSAFVAYAMLNKSPVRLLTILSCLCCIHFVSGCNSIPRNALVLDVPFLPQEQDNHCGVIALSMALDYYGIKWNTQKLTEAVFVPALGGSTLSTIASTAEGYGLKAVTTQSSHADLVESLYNRHLPIIYLAPVDPNKIGHFVVVTGASVNGRYLCIHDKKQANRWIKTTKLKHRSSESLFPTVTLSPNDHL